MHSRHFTRIGTRAISSGMNIIVLAVVAVLFSIASSAQSLDVMLVLDTTPGTEQSTDRIRAKQFGAGDLVGVVGAVPPARLWLPLTKDKEKLADTLQRVSLRVGATIGNVSIAQSAPLDLAGAISEACAQFGESAVRSNRRAILVVFAGEDRNLPAAAQRLRAQLDTVDAKLFAILVTRMPPQPPLGRPGSGIPVWPTPVLTTEILGHLAKGTGGRIYRQGWDLKSVLKDAMQP